MIQHLQQWKQKAVTRLDYLAYAAQVRSLRKATFVMTGAL